MDAAHSTPTPSHAQHTAALPVTPIGGPLPSLAGRSVAFGADDTVASGVNTSHTDTSPASDDIHTSGYAATVSSVDHAPSSSTLTATLRTQLLRLADQAQRVAAALPADLQAANAPHAERLLSLAAEHLERAAIESIRLPREVLKTPPKGR